MSPRRPAQQVGLLGLSGLVVPIPFTGTQGEWYWHRVGSGWAEITLQLADIVLEETWGANEQSAIG